MSIKKIIDDWDPVNLLSHAPQNEYHTEIDEVEKLLKGTKNCDEIAQGIYEIFLRAFGDNTFQCTIVDCMKIANEIIESIVETT